MVNKAWRGTIWVRSDNVIWTSVLSRFWILDLGLVPVWIDRTTSPPPPQRIGHHGDTSFFGNIFHWRHYEHSENTPLWGYLRDLLEQTPPKDVVFIIGDWNAKVGSQETPGVTGKFGLGVQTEAGRRLIGFCQENALVIANTLCQQQKRRLYTWTSPDGRHQNQIDYILCSQRWRSSIQSAKIRPGADCGSDHELLIAKFRLKLKKVGKTTRPFRYDLNQIPYD